MKHSERIAREDVISECLRALDIGIGDEQPTDQALRIMKEIKALRAPDPLVLAQQPNDTKYRTRFPTDYLERVQDAARAAWLAQWQHGDVDPAHDATAGVDTPLGRLRCTVWQRQWAGKVRQTTTWASEYALNDEPISVREIRAAGLAQRPTTRNRKKK